MSQESFSPFSVRHSFYVENKFLGNVLHIEVYHKIGILPD